MSIYRERTAVKIQSMKIDKAVLMRENIIIVFYLIQNVAPSHVKLLNFGNRNK